MEHKIDLNDKNTKVYELIMYRKGETGDFEYSDFVRQTTPEISEQKAEIRRNIAEYGFDKKVESVVNGTLKNIDFRKLPKDKGQKMISSQHLVAKIAWNEDLKMPILLDIGFYRHRG